MKASYQLRRDAFYTAAILFSLSIAFVLYLNANAQEPDRPAPPPDRIGPPIVSPISPMSPVYRYMLPLVYKGGE